MLNAPLPFPFGPALHFLLSVWSLATFLFPGFAETDEKLPGEHVGGSCIDHKAGHVNNVTLSPIRLQEYCRTVLRCVRGYDIHTYIHTCIYLHADPSEMYRGQPGGYLYRVGEIAGRGRPIFVQEIQVYAGIWEFYILERCYYKFKY